MNYITTNIRIPEEDYLRLKAEAAQKRKSFAEVVRQKIQKEYIKKTKDNVAQLLKETEKLAAKNAKKLKGIDGVTILREIRYNSKW